MSLRDRLNRIKNGNGTEGADGSTATTVEEPAAVPAPSTTPTSTFGAAGRASGEIAALSPVEQLKVTLHRRLIERLDLQALEEITDERERTSQIRQVVGELLRAEATPLSQGERDEIVEEVVYEIIGLGPIEPLFRDSSISDILVNGARDIYVEKKGRLSRVNTSFRNDAHLLAVIDRIVSRVGRRVDESSPMVDARLPDGSRVNAIIPPLALDGPVLSIRRFATTLDVRGLVANGALNAEMAQLLAACVHARLNILISGGTGAGKSTLLNALSSFIPGDERIITIEDAAELRLQQEHVVRLETRPPNVEGRGEVVARDLVKNALRMRPNRIIVGEVRSVEALDMLQAMNTGHEGSMTTIHANTPRDAISRLETMLLMAGTTLPARAMREQIAAAIDVVVQVSRLSDGTRRISSITEVQGLEGDVVTTADIFQFRRRGVSPQGRVLGHFEATGVRPHFAERLAVAGAQLPADLFREPSRTRLSEMEHEAEESTRAASLERFDAIAHTLPSHARGTAIGEIPAPSPFQRDGEGDGRAVATLTAERRRLQATVDESQRALAAAREEIAALQQQVRARPASAPNDGAAAAELARLRTQAETALADAAALRDQQRRSAVAMLAFVEALDETREIAASPEGDCRQAVNRLGSRATWFIDAVGLHETARVGDPIRADEHDVLERVPRTAGQQEGEIVRVVQRGFRLGDRVLRRAQVVVAS